ncbi:alpha/beta hydrolase [Peribacillus cavernae]|uniref:Alpha/beta hydrolase n=1 Tax=Peribacillus cavernae TaxID=1674310 RepID=A0A3S1B995_9BACI|nr:alpha/beta hydrolase [Peribacillus cavernae]MDQ0218857.1 acetyl esterase [Peribacillus cavernae]RUQ31058.1 alpha/beta hydrolase [Peribacillus cavernae]
MSLHPQAKALLEMLQAREALPMEQQTVSEARAAYAKMCTLLNKRQETHKVEERKIEGFQNEISVRIYTPSEEKPLPALVYFHGGGWVIGDLETHDALCRSLANEAECIVVSVDYSLSPESKFPVAARDAYLAVKWTADHAEELGIEKSSLAVGGDSAGGNLAAVVCYLANQRKGPSISYQMLFYPSTGYAKTPSSDMYGEGYHLTKSTMKWFQEQYLNHPDDTKSPLASPMLIPEAETRLLPPAYIMTAEYDPLRDGGKMYAEKLKNASIEATYVCYPGMIHGFLTMSEALDDCSRAIKEAAQSLKAHFTEKAASSK